MRPSFAALPSTPPGRFVPPIGGPFDALADGTVQLIIDALANGNVQLIIAHAQVGDLESFCATDHRVRDLCHDDVFWRRLCTDEEYPMPPPPLRWALYHYVRHRSAAYATRVDQRLLDAVHAGDAVAVRGALHAGAAVNGNIGGQALRIASEAGAERGLPMVRVLLDGGVNPTEAALTAAVDIDDVAVVRALLDANMIPGDETHPPEQFIGRDVYNDLVCDAAARGYTATMMALIDYGASVRDGFALRSAALEGHLDTVNALIDHGADDFASVASDALLAAVGYDHTAIMHALLGAGADARADQSSALAFAAGHGNPEAVRTLIDNGADARAQESRAFIEAAAVSRRAATGDARYDDVLRMLVAAGADVDAQDSLALYQAVDRHGVRTVRWLLEAGCRIPGALVTHAIEALHVSQARPPSPVSPNYGPVASMAVPARPAGPGAHRRPAADIVHLLVENERSPLSGAHARDIRAFLRAYEDLMPRRE
jgi:ankyrin repeat protein